jgi:hypothetical protein
MSPIQKNVRLSTTYIFAIGLFLVIGGVAWGFLSPVSLPVIDSSQLTIKQTDTEVEQQLAIRIRNSNWRTIQIVGCQGNGCGPGGCVYGVEPETCDIAPGETKEIFVRYKSPPVAGPFEKEFIIYSATNTLNEHKLKVTGVAVKAKKGSDSHHQDTKSTKGNAEERSDVVAKDK